MEASVLIKGEILSTLFNLSIYFLDFSSSQSNKMVATIDVTSSVLEFFVNGTKVNWNIYRVVYSGQSSNFFYHRLDKGKISPAGMDSSLLPPQSL